MLRNLYLRPAGLERQRRAGIFHLRNLLLTLTVRTVCTVDNLYVLCLIYQRKQNNPQTRTNKKGVSTACVLPRNSHALRRPPTRSNPKTSPHSPPGRSHNSPGRHRRR
jgi:hypothetical protein